jgi:hypothetical protein
VALCVGVLVHPYRALLVRSLRADDVSLGSAPKLLLRGMVLTALVGRSHSVQGLGYTAVRAQLFTVPPYAVAAVLTGERGGLLSPTHPACPDLLSSPLTSHRGLCVRPPQDPWPGHARFHASIRHRLRSHRPHER